jgi:hypothetical protein
MSIKIEEYTYKGFPIQINFASGDGWGDWKNKFYSETPLPFNVEASKDIETLKAQIKMGIDQWCAKQPKTNEEWVDLVTQCVIQDGYEDWHVDEHRIMNVLERYVKFKNRAS